MEQSLLKGSRGHTSREPLALFASLLLYTTHVSKTRSCAVVILGISGNHSLVLTVPASLLAEQQVHASCFSGHHMYTVDAMQCKASGLERAPPNKGNWLCV